MVNDSSALGIGISPDKSCSGSPRDRFVSRVLGRSSPFFSSGDGSGTDTQSLPGLLPRSLSDNPENVPTLDGNIRCGTISCILDTLACIRTSSEYLARFSCSLALGVHQQARVVVHPDSMLDAEHQATYLSKLQRSPRKALDPVCGPQWHKHPSMLTSRQTFIRTITMPHGTRPECPWHVQQSTETPASERRWDSRHDSKDQKETLLSSPQLT